MRAGFIFAAHSHYPRQLWVGGGGGDVVVVIVVFYLGVDSHPWDAESSVWSGCAAVHAAGDSDLADGSGGS